jgi:hypothetical protein
MKNKNRERGTHRSLASGDGAVASVQRKIRSHSNVAERRGGGGIVDGNVGCRQASAPVWSRTAVVLLRCPFGPARKRDRQKNGGRRRHRGGKKSKFTPTPVFIPKRLGSWGSWGVFHYPDRFCERSPHGGTEWGGGYCNYATR